MTASITGKASAWIAIVTVLTLKACGLAYVDDDTGLGVGDGDGDGDGDGAGSDNGGQGGDGPGVGAAGQGGENGDGDQGDGDGDAGDGDTGDGDAGSDSWLFPEMQGKLEACGFWSPGEISEYYALYDEFFSCAFECMTKYDECEVAKDFFETFWCPEPSLGPNSQDSPLFACLQGCPDSGYPTTTCGGGEELSIYYVCDGYPQCEDGADEMDCLTCDGGDIIPSYYVCDGYQDCLDGTDEGSQCFQLACD